VKTIDFIYLVLGKLKNVLKFTGVFFRAEKKTFFTKSGRWLLAFIILLFAYIIALDLNFLWLFGNSPSIKDILHPQQNIASEIYSEDGVLLGKYYYENRVPVSYVELSELLIKTLIATEDERYYKHSGIDLIGSVAAFAGTLKGKPRGASTITQQLVKNLYKTRDKRKYGILSKIPFVNILIFKSKEMINAFKLEMRFDKKDILTLYLNTVDFGNNAFGIKTAARTYFNTVPALLKPEQCALLVGMLKATTTYNPVTNRRKAYKRRNVVLSIMKEHGIISDIVNDSLQKLPVSSKIYFEKVTDGKAFYFRQELLANLKPWLNEKNLDVYAGGLKIYTTLNSKMQDYAETALTKHMKQLQRTFDLHWQGLNPWVDSRDKEIPGFVEMIVMQSGEYKKLHTQFAEQPDSIDFHLNKKVKQKIFSWNGAFDSLISLREAINYNLRFLHAGFVAIEPQTGNVKAWVGGINYSFFKFDNVDQSRRQPGSTFKTFVYAAAIDNGFAPCDSVQDSPVLIKYLENGEKKQWSPHNADWTYLNQNVTLKYAFARSLNTASVQIAEKIGWKTVIDYAHRMGIKSSLDTFPSVCLGVSDVSLIELVSAYCPIANGGYRIEPQMVTKITDRHNKLLGEFSAKSDKVLSDETAFLMQRMFLGTMTEPRGTTQALYAYDLFRYNTDIGGKTGTSSNYSDGWFLGVTPNIVAGAWVGGEQRSIHFRTSALGEGAKTALPICGLFFEKVLKDSSFVNIRGHFKKLPNATEREYTCQTRHIPPDSVIVDDTSSILPW
jgi:penicillin-binding protein 1A